MQNHDWIDLFRMIPEAEHNTLVLTTLSGVDLSIEIILRTELTYLVFRGRVCGNTDDGRVFFLPYRQIDYLQINRTVKEAEIRDLFGENEPPKSAFAAPGSALGLPNGSSKSGFSITASPESSHHAVPMTPQVPAAALRPGAMRTNVPPPRPGKPAGAPGTAVPNIPAAALVPPTTGTNGAAAPAAPRNSILERLRAQRNSILPPRAPGR